jgi:hypothetical protein
MDLRSILKTLKFGPLIPPQLKDDGDFAGNTYFDTLGLSGLLVVMHVGTVDAAIGSTAEGNAVKLEECDTTDGTYTDITSAALADAIAATEDDSLFAIAVDLTRSHKRYIEITTPHAGDGTTGCNLSAIAIGFPSDESPRNAAGMGLAELIEA